MAKWTRAYIDRLPNEAFLYVDKRTGKRSLPVMNHKGEISVPHLNNAKARLNQTNISQAAKRDILREINRLQKEAGVEAAQ